MTSWNPFQKMSREAQNALRNYTERPCRACDQPIRVGQRMTPWKPRKDVDGVAVASTIPQWQHLDCSA